MASSEFSRSSQPGGRRRPLGALIIVVVLCLMAFLLGIFVGVNQQADLFGSGLSILVASDMA